MDLIDRASPIQGFKGICKEDIKLRSHLVIVMRQRNHLFRWSIVRPSTQGIRKHILFARDIHEGHARLEFAQGTLPACLTRRQLCVRTKVPQQGLVIRFGFELATQETMAEVTQRVNHTQ